MMDLSVICINWNSVGYLRQCLASVYANTKGLEFEVVVVDNASTDGEPHLLKTEFPHVTLIRSDRNLGFAKANNLGYEYASGEYLLFLNPDTVVIGSAIATLIERLRELPDAGVGGCRLLNSDLSVQTSCIQRFPTILNQLLDIEWLRLRWPRWPFWGIGALFSDSEEPAEVEVISGACLMVKRDVFEKVGLFSDEYFMYADDVDLCYKARQMGLKSYYVGSASVIHHGGGSSRLRKTNQWVATMQRVSILKFCRKTHGRTYAFMYRVAVGVAAFFRVLVISFLYPVKKVTGGDQSLSFALVKWAAVFRWAIGLDAGSVRLTDSH